ncbi:DUF5804 family protein [Methanofollis tationis]|uniref:Uncharacterized protein n=1 Tax=Methanofollis tationis TaxID=81417 RepID=A0A7K4HNC2_9EURY|nr:DUF5804 family protein [Methanofollis tationis]NVO66348.1 hypothetical protein [Methanofollis tationis]
MRLILVQRDGTDLYTTLFSSETSREILRFYRPEKTPYGVSVRVISLGAALALAAELRWYLKRYVALALFEMAPGRCCTLACAHAIEQREVDPDRPPDRRLYIRFQEGRPVVTEGPDGDLEVWALPGETIGER